MDFLLENDYLYNLKVQSAYVAQGSSPILCVYDRWVPCIQLKNRKQRLGVDMKDIRMAGIMTAAIACLVLLVSAGGAAASEVRLLKGDVWQQMSQDEKVAFIWGVGQVVTVEQAIAEKMPELKRDDFSAKVVEGMAGTPINEVVATVDRYYAANPEKQDLPVIRVVWDEMIRPNIKTGIGGRPLE